MIRFANPGSDIGSFTRIYQALFEELQASQPFSLDDISAALVRRNLATSSGYAGEEALSRSTRHDRSRDPLYNQSKMYSELFRLLGWIHPTADSRLSFVLTWLGAHVVAAGPHAKPLVRECVLGIAFPNSVVAAKGDYRLRPFALILRTIDHLGGLLCRDEMIVGPLSLGDDTDSAAVQTMVAAIAALRGPSPTKLARAVAALARKRGTQVNTLENYTRFPLAVLEWSGWTDKVRESGPYGRSIVFHRLTAAGAEQVQLIKQSQDLRGDSLPATNAKVRHAAAKLGAVSMLERAGFDSTQLAPERERWVHTLLHHKILPSASAAVIFSPFQELPPDESANVFGEVGTKTLAAPPQTTGASPITPVGRGPALTTTVRLLKRAAQAGLTVQPRGASPAERTLRASLASGRTLEGAADHLLSSFEASNKIEFYPAVSDLFRLLGYDCGTSRVGVNYQRWDAFITHPSDSVPIEIKSPGEERYISVKGVRQALENKVILLSRPVAPCRRETTSLVVGFLVPSARAEVADLISDISYTFNVTIGVVDFRSLALLAAAALRGAPHDADSLLSLKGFIDVATT